MDAVQTMAFTGSREDIWHRKGEQVTEERVQITMREHKCDSMEAWRILSGTNYNVRKVKLYAPKPQHLVGPDGHRAIDAGIWGTQREDTGHVFGPCGKSYVVTQPWEAMEFYREFIEAGEAKMSTAGALLDGSLVWFLADLNVDFNVGGTNDRVTTFLLIGVPLKPGAAVIIKQVKMRVVCFNTYTAAIGEGGREYRHVHRTKFDETAIEEAKHVLGLAREQVQLDEQVANALYNKPVSEADMVRVISELFGCEDVAAVVKAYGNGRGRGDWDDFKKLANRSTKGAIASYFKAPGATPGNLWGVFNGITYYTDHNYGRNADNRLRSGWFGKMDGVKRNALATLSDMAGVVAS